MNVFEKQGLINFPVTKKLQSPYFPVFLVNGVVVVFVVFFFFFLKKPKTSEQA